MSANRTVQYAKFESGKLKSNPVIGAHLFGEHQRDSVDPSVSEAFFLTFSEIYSAFVKIYPTMAITITQITNHANKPMKSLQSFVLTLNFEAFDVLFPSRKHSKPISQIKFIDARSRAMKNRD